jgi:hypothetical protein
MSKVVRITRVQKLPTSFPVIHAAPLRCAQIARLRAIGKIKITLGSALEDPWILNSAVQEDRAMILSVPTARWHALSRRQLITPAAGGDPRPCWPLRAALDGGPRARRHLGQSLRRNARGPAAGLSCLEA